MSQARDMIYYTYQSHTGCPKKKGEQAQRRAAAETATRKLIGHFKRSMYDFLQAS